MSETLRSSERPPVPRGPGPVLPRATGPARGPESPPIAARVRTWLLDQMRAPYVQLLIGQLTVGGTAALANVLMARSLDPSGRGLIALLLQVAYLSSQLLLLGSERSFIAGYHGSSPAAGVRAYGSLVVRPCLAALSLVVLAAVVLPANLRPTRTVLALLAAFTLVNVLVQVVRAVAIATTRYAGYLSSTLVSQVLVLATMVGLYLAGSTSPAVWFSAYVLANALPTAVCALYWSRAGDGTATGERLSAVVGAKQRRSVRREGLALLPAALANMGMLRFDRLILPALATTAALGLYATVATMTELVSWPAQAYADSRLGVWRAAHRSGDLRVSSVLAGAVAYAAVVGPILGTATYLLVVPLFGERYASAKGLVLPLVAAASLYAVSRVSLALLIARGRNLLASGAESVGFVTSLAGYVLLIPLYGAYGAAYGSLIGYGTCLAFSLVVLGGPGRRWRSRS